MYTHIVMMLDYNQIIDESLRELRQRVKEREETDRRIGQLVKALRGLAPMLPESERAGLFTSLKTARRKGLGLTEVILDILRDSDLPLSVSDIRDRMEDAGFDLAEYSQASSTIHNTLRRLVDSRRAVPVFPKGSKDQLRWQWAGGKK